ncbi:MAG: hypothetical protein HFE57_03495 [Firmicutes bacterium]|nr:hypothetical protein [Bacillota bacterium]
MAKQEKYDENLTVSKETDTEVEKKENEVHNIKDVLTEEEINDTKRCYAAPGDNETKNGVCIICGKSTMYAARHLCYEHYKQYLQ